MGEDLIHETSSLTYNFPMAPLSLFYIWGSSSSENTSHWPKFSELPTGRKRI